ncbi:MAG: methionyl-tRNA formyltransferase [Limisphaerales bacterium]
MKDKMSGFCSFDSLMAGRDIPYRKVVDINDRKHEDEMRSLGPDLIVQVGWSQIISDRILSIPILGCVGFHSSLLPKDRGGSPVNWALIRGEKRWGTTLFYLEPGLDNGDIIGQEQFDVTLEDTCRTVYQQCGQAMVGLLEKYLPGILARSAPRVKQDDSVATRNKRRKPEDGLIDWNKTSMDLYNWIRALTHPYPGAFSYWSGRKIYIWKSSLMQSSPEMRVPSSAPGTIVDVSPGRGVVVKTKDGILLLEMLEREGEGLMDFTQISKLKKNEYFSNGSAS